MERAALTIICALFSSDNRWVKQALASSIHSDSSWSYLVSGSSSFNMGRKMSSRSYSRSPYERMQVKSKPSSSRHARIAALTFFSTSFLMTCPSLVFADLFATSVKVGGTFRTCHFFSFGGRGFKCLDCGINLQQYSNRLRKQGFKLVDSPDVMIHAEVLSCWAENSAEGGTMVCWAWYSETIWRRVSGGASSHCLEVEPITTEDRRLAVLQPARRCPESNWESIDWLIPAFSAISCCFIVFMGHIFILRS